MSPETKGNSSPGSFAGGMLRIVEHFAGRVGAIVLGLLLIVLGIGLGVTMVLLPVGVIVGLIGLFIFIAGVFGPAFRRGGRGS